MEANYSSTELPKNIDFLYLNLEYLDAPEDCLRELVEKLVNLKSLDISGKYVCDIGFICPLD